MNAPGLAPGGIHRSRAIPRSTMAGMAQVPEVRGELDGYIERLHLLGATEEELMAVVATWDTFDEDWTPAIRKRWTRATDAELIAGLQASRVEYLHDTTHDDGLWQPGMEVPAGSEDELLAWVGTDRDRAYAVYETELSRDEFARRGLIAKLEPMIGAF